jgi:hypothetical protein
MSSTNMGALVGLVLLSGCAGARSPADDARPLPSATTQADSPKQQPATMNIKTSGDAREVARLLPNWALVGTGTVNAALGKPTAWHRHPPTGTCMPEGLGDFVLKNRVDSSADDIGVSLYNRVDATVLSFFTYPATNSLAAESRGVTDGMCKGAASMSTELRDVRFADRGIISACFHESVAGPAYEQALIFSGQGWFYQVRFTFLQGDLYQQYANAMAVAQTAFRACGPS